MKVSKRIDDVSKSFDHYSACQGRSLRKPNLIAIEKWYLISVLSWFITVYEIWIKIIGKATPVDKKQIDV